MQRLVKAEPKNGSAYIRLGQAYQNAQDYKKALAFLDIGIGLGPAENLSYAYRDRANCKNNLRNDTGAVHDMNLAIGLNPRERCFYIDRGDYRFNLDSLDLSLNDFSQALSLFNGETWPRLGVAKVLVAKGEYRSAISEYVRIPEHDMSSVEDIYYRGLARYHTNDQAGACADWTSVAGLSDEACDSARLHCGSAFQKKHLQKSE